MDPELREVLIMSMMSREMAGRQFMMSLHEMGSKSRWMFLPQTGWWVTVLRKLVKTGIKAK